MAVLKDPPVAVEILKILKPFEIFWFSHSSSWSWNEGVPIGREEWYVN